MNLTPSIWLLTGGLLPALASMLQIDVITAADLDSWCNQLDGEEPELGRDAVIDVARVSLPGINGELNVNAILHILNEYSRSSHALLNIYSGGSVTDAAQPDDALTQFDSVVVAYSCRSPSQELPPTMLSNYCASLRLSKSEGCACGRVGVRDTSAGGGFAPGFAVLAENSAEIGLDQLQLTYLMLDDRIARHCKSSYYVWTVVANCPGWDSPLPEHDRSSPLPSATSGRATALTSLPPMFLAVGFVDLFTHQALSLTSGLSGEGAPTEFHICSGVYYNFDTPADTIAAQNLACDEPAGLDRTLRNQATVSP